MPDSPAKREPTISAFAALSDRDTENALQEAGKLNGEGRETALRGIAKQLAAKDFEKALAVATGAETSAQQGIFREIARVAAYQKPDNAVRILEDPVLSQVIGADLRQEMLNATVTTWAKQDLPAAQAWVAKLPASDAPKGVQGLMTTWMKADPVAASGWLTALPVGPAREAGARVVIEQIKDTDPEMAEQWRKTLAPER
jgi:hypothetical protein